MNLPMAAEQFGLILAVWIPMFIITNVVIEVANKIAWWFINSLNEWAVDRIAFEKAQELKRWADKFNGVSK